MANPFEILGLRAVFAVDAAQLQRRYIDLSAANHPDRFQDPLDQADAAERAAAINEAYYVIKNPEGRAVALLGILGEPGSAGDEKALPANLLMEMMEIREEMETAVAEKNGATLVRLKAWAETERETILGRVGGQLDAAAASAGQGRVDLLRRVRIDLNALRYVQRMLEQMPTDR